MPFVFSQLLNHGSSHPVVARLQVQVSNLLQGSTASPARREAIFGAAFEASRRLINCWDTRDRLKAQCERLEAEFQPPTDNRGAVHIPSIITLQHDAETFLYEAK